MNTTYPPTTDPGWIDWGRNATDQWSETPAAFRLTPQAAGAARTAFDLFSDAYVAASDSLTRSTPRIQTKNDTLAAFKAIVKPIVATLQADVLITNTQRAELGLKVRSTPTPAPTPGTPSVTAILTGQDSMRLVARDPLLPDRRARPAGVMQLAVHTFFTTGNELPPADRSQWPLTVLSGRTNVDLMWPGLTGETTVWVCCCWVNSRNVRGGISTTTSVRLPGSGLSSVAAQKPNDATMKIAA